MSALFSILAMIRPLAFIARDSFLPELEPSQEAFFK